MQTTKLDKCCKTLGYRKILSHYAKSPSNTPGLLLIFRNENFALDSQLSKSLRISELVGADRPSSQPYNNDLYSSMISSTLVSRGLPPVQTSLRASLATNSISSSLNPTSVKVLGIPTSLPN